MTRMPLIGICASREIASWTVWNRQPAVLVGDAYVTAVRGGTFPAEAESF